MPTWKNTIKAKTDVPFHLIVSVASYLGYSYVIYNGEVYAVVDYQTAILTPNAPLE
jgi:hypothetical protein